MKIRVLCVVLLLMLSSAAAALVYSTKFDGVILRRGPASSYEQVLEMPRYYPLKVLTRADQWCKVKDWLGTAGWVERGKLCSLRTAVVRRPRVNLRQGPGSRYKVAAKLYQGYIVKIVKYYRGWYKVMVLDPPEEKIGWLSARLIWG